jgi:hypothetical protein
MHFSKSRGVWCLLQVGILTPDWLAGSRYLGPATTDNFTTHVWTKAKFINYYADQVGRDVCVLLLGGEGDQEEGAG